MTMQLNYTFQHSARPSDGNLQTNVYINGQLEATLFASCKFPSPRKQKQQEKFARQQIKPMVEV